MSDNIMWEVITPMLLVKEYVSFWIDCEQKEEGEEGAEGLKLVFTDITWLGQYMVFIVKGHEKCVNWVSVDRKKSAAIIILRLSDAICFILISTFIYMTRKLFKPKAVFCNAYILPETMGYLSIAQLMILQQSK